MQVSCRGSVKNGHLSGIMITAAATNRRYLSLSFFPVDLLCRLGSSGLGNVASFAGWYAQPT